ncbi:MAG: DUF2927 domain-containing protein [Shimia sp.]
MRGGRFHIARSLRRVGALAALLAVGACGVIRGPVEPVPRPIDRPIRTAAPVAPPVQPPLPSIRTDQDLELYYTRLQNDNMARGLMRLDGGGIDTRYTAATLTQNFIDIGLASEFGGPTPLQRWAGPVRISVEYGGGVPSLARSTVQTELQRYVPRLSRVSRHPISLTSGLGDFRVFVLTDGERRAFGPTLRTLVPGIGPSLEAAFTQAPRTDLCLVLTAGLGNTLTRAVAVIRAELTPALLRSCVHEEVAQGLGLTNDSPRARPSIFNDDEEFALLTTHDEQLLRILYDRRLRPGMTAAQARPIVAQIATEILGPASTPGPV